MSPNVAVIEHIQAEIRTDIAIYFSVRPLDYAEFLFQIGEAIGVCEQAVARDQAGDGSRIIKMPLRTDHHHSFTVSNADRSIGFYRDLLGLQLIQDVVREDLESYDRIVGFQNAR